MPLRIFKRKSAEKCNRNLESNTEETSTDTGPGCKSNTNAHYSLDQDVIIEGGSVIPKRVFVGGLVSHVTEWDLRMKFANFGIVKTVKIIRDHMGISKGYGFVTYSTEEEAKKAIEKSEMIFKGRKLNIAPAIKRQQNQGVEIQTWSGNQMETYSRAATDHEFVQNVTGEFPPVLDYSGCALQKSINYPLENAGQIVDGAVYFNAMDLPYGYRNAQVNILPYPTFVYIPQTLQCPGVGITYPMNGAAPELMQALPVGNMGQ